MGKHKSSHKKKKRKHHKMKRSLSVSSSSSEKFKSGNRKKLKPTNTVNNQHRYINCAISPRNTVTHDNDTVIPEGNYNTGNDQMYKSFENEMYGPVLPSLTNKVDANLVSEKIDFDDGDDKDIIGPLPPSVAGDDIQHQLDQRVELLKEKFKNEKEKTKKINKRESWMLELPEEKSVALGLSARKFKLHESGNKNNRSLWTETPDVESSIQQEIKNDAQAEDFREICRKQRDDTMEKMIKNCKNLRSEKSLLEIHREHLNKNKQTEDKVRRPFDRDVDLQTNRFDEKQKKSIIKKAQQLDSRFSQGRSKYL